MGKLRDFFLGASPVTGAEVQVDNLKTISFEANTLPALIKIVQQVRAKAGMGRVGMRWEWETESLVPCDTTIDVSVVVRGDKAVGFGWSVQMTQQIHEYLQDTVWDEAIKTYLTSG